MKYLLMFYLFFYPMKLFKEYTIELINGEKIKINYLSPEEASELLSDGSWLKIESKIKGLFFYKNTEEKYLRLNYQKNYGILYENENDFQYTANSIPAKVVILQSLDLSYLIYFQLLSYEEKNNYLTSHTYKKVDSLSKKRDYDILLLDNGKVMLSLINDDGELYNSLKDYIEVRKTEGDPFLGVAIPGIDH